MAMRPIRSGPARPRASLPLGALGGSAALLLLLMGGTPERVSAQELGTRCTPESFRTIVGEEPIPGRRITWMGRPTLRCPDGVRIQADSAVIYQDTGRNELIGNVRFTSANRILLGALVDYYERDGRLFARGNVHFTDRTRDLEIEGDTLIYLEANPFRSEDEVTVYGGRPRTTLPGPESESGEPSEPYQVEGDRLQFLGERFFWAFGNATVERDDLRAAADTFAFDQSADELNLSGSAWMESGTTRAEGERLNVIFEDGLTRRIAATGEARLLDDEMEMLGDDIQVTLGPDEKPTSIVARAAPGGPRAEARTEEMALYARTLEIDLPDGILTEIRAIGEALGVTFGEEGRVEAEPSDSESLPTNDFIGGNEILATFEPVPPPEAGDPALEAPLEGEDAPGPRYRLNFLEATGNAVTLYRSPPDGWDPEEGPPPAARWAISYIMANRILITMEDGEVGFVHAEGNVVGAQLEPERAPMQAPNGRPGGGESR